MELNEVLKYIATFRITNGCNFWVYSYEGGFCSAMDSCKELAPTGTCNDCLYGRPDCPTVCGEEGRCIGLLVCQQLSKKQLNDLINLV